MQSVTLRSNNEGKQVSEWLHTVSHFGCKFRLLELMDDKAPLKGDGGWASPVSPKGKLEIRRGASRETGGRSER